MTINPHTDPVVRGKTTQFTATVTDDKDSQASLNVDWGEFRPDVFGRCDWITAAAWGSPLKSRTLANFVPYEFVADSLDTACLCARSTDHNGAIGVGCQGPFTPVNPPPEATIVDVAGILSGQPRPLCSKVHLSAEGSDFPQGDKIDFIWSIQNSASDPAAELPQLAVCTDTVTGNPDQHRCFTAKSQGAYTVTLVIKDTFSVNGGSDSATSAPATFEIFILGDTPPCLRRTDPDVYAQRILLSRSSDLGGTYESRTFKVLNVDDDCEPYPLTAGATNAPAKFVWSVLDATKASRTWTYQTNTSDAYTVSQAQFPNARPGDTVKLRVEVRDTPVQQFYQAGGQVCSMDTADFCCGSVACGGANDCLRWTTWTVQFQP